MIALPSYLQEAYNSSADTKSLMAILRQAIIDHPEDELMLTQQLAIYSSVDDIQSLSRFLLHLVQNGFIKK